MFVVVLKFVFALACAVSLSLSGARIAAQRDQSTEPAPVASIVKTKPGIAPIWGVRGGGAGVAGAQVKPAPSRELALVACFCRREQGEGHFSAAGERRPTPRWLAISADRLRTCVVRLLI